MIKGCMAVSERARGRSDKLTRAFGTIPVQLFSDAMLPSAITPLPSTDNRAPSSSCPSCSRGYIWLLNDKLRCQRCGHEVCNTCIKARAPLYCHGISNRDVPVCEQCYASAEIENRWHAYTFRNGDKDESIQRVLKSQAESGNVLTAFGCVCGSQHVVKDTVLKFSGMSRQRMCQDRAAAYLLAVGCKAITRQQMKDSSAATLQPVVADVDTATPKVELGS